MLLTAGAQDMCSWNTSSFTMLFSMYYTHNTILAVDGKCKLKYTLNKFCIHANTNTHIHIYLHNTYCWSHARAHTHTHTHTQHLHTCWNFWSHWCSQRVWLGPQSSVGGFQPLPSREYYNPEKQCHVYHDDITSLYWAYIARWLNHQITICTYLNDISKVTDIRLLSSDHLLDHMSHMG